VSSSDWIALYAVGADNHQYLTYFYTGGAPTGYLDFTAPTVLGIFEFRYLLLGGYQDVATSNAVTVRCTSDVTPTGPKVLVLTGGDSSSDCAALQVLIDRGFDVSTTVSAPAWDGTQANLDDFAAVVLFHNANWVTALQQTGLDALADYVARGGGLVTGEWSLWGAFTRGQTTLVSLAPVAEYCGFNHITGTTYSRAVSDPIVNDGLPESFGFTLANIAGTESCFAARPEATVFFTSSNGGGRADADGVIGWSVGRGHVASISTLVSATELGDPNYRRLLGNLVTWASLSNCDAEPPAMTNVAAFNACLSGPGVVMDPACAPRDLDCNGRIDLRDVWMFQREFAAP